MKILIGADTYWPDINGASYFTQRLAAQLAAHGHVVHVACPARTIGAEQSTRDGVTIHGIPSLPLPFQGGFRAAVLPDVPRSLQQVVADVSPDVIHVQSHFPVGRTLIKLGRQLGIGLIATNHFMPDNLVYHLHLPPRAEAVVSEWAWRDFVRVFSQVPIVTTPTPIAAQLIVAHGIQRPVHAISCGIDRDRFNPQVDGDGFRERHHIPRRPTVLYVGRLDREKNIDVLIRAFAIVRQRLDAQLVIVGGGNESGYLKTMARVERVNDATTFTGVVSDVELPAAYAAADVFCLMSTAELQSIASLEAMASGLPLVLADAVALPHLVVPGRNGYLIPPGDVTMLADRLVELLADPARQRAMGDASYERSQEHALPTMVGRFEQMYGAVLSGVTVPDSLPAYQY